MQFAALDLDPRLSRAVAARGFELTTPIQSATFPLILAGADVIACAQTGTGKTAAFLIPILQRLLTAGPHVGPSAPQISTRVLVLAPTRELAVQIDSDVDGFAYDTGLSSVAVYGGVGAAAQSHGLGAPADLVVATPGRLLDHLRSGGTRFDGLEVLVLDEADRMLDMGFWPDVRRIVEALPRVRQTLFFSATMSDDVFRSASQIMREPRMIRIDGGGGLPSTIAHRKHQVPAADKTAWLASFLRRTGGSTLIFTRTKHGAERLSRRLTKAGVRCAALHGDRTQGQRSAAIEGFRSGRYTALVATDIAARGLDIDGIGHVVNYDLPDSPDSYLHRVGRTGRADAVGTALTLVGVEELGALRTIEQSLNIRFSDTRASATDNEQPPEREPARGSRPKSGRSVKTFTA
jgi:ATP-dependent RNA helicase RhlE